MPFVIAEAGFGYMTFEPASGKITSTDGPALQSLTEARFATNNSGKVVAEPSSCRFDFLPPVMVIGAQFI